MSLLPIHLGISDHCTVPHRGEYLSKKSETVYPPIWGILKQSVLLNKKIQCLHNKKCPSGLLKYVVIGGKKAFRAESGLIRDLFWTR